MNLPVSRRIGWRIAALTGLVGLAITGVAAYLLLAAETRAFKDAARRQLLLVAELVQGSVPLPEVVGQEHQWDRLFAGGGAGVQATQAVLRIVQVDGTILASNQEAEVGQRLPEQRLADLRRSSDPARRGRRLESSGGDEIFLPERYSLLRPIELQGGCLGRCHPRSDSIKAWLDIEVRGDRLHRGIHRFRQLAIGTWLGLLVTLLLVVALLVHLFLGRPLLSLARAMEKVEEGDFLVRAPEEGKDEIGELAKAFNKLLRRITDLRVNVLDTNIELKSELGLKQQLEERSRALEQANRRLEARFGDLALLFEVSKVVSSSLDLERILSVFTERLATSMQIPRVAVTLICGDSESLTVISAHGFPEPERVLGLVFPRGEGIPWAALERQEPVVVQDTRDDPRVSYFLGRVREEGSLSAIPFRHKGSTIGVLLLGRPDGSGFCSDEVRLLTAISEQVAMAVANAQLHEEARTLAITDPLTGLYNRRFLANRLELEASRSLRFGQPLSMLMVDIDHFKEYNDANGHLFGDRALIKISQLLSSSLRQVDTVARYGGEEFVVLLPHTDAQGAFAVADKLRRMVAQAEFPHCIENAGEKLTISIGVATWAAEDGGKPEDALASADRALYRAKEEGRDRVVLTSCS